MCGIFTADTFGMYSNMCQSTNKRFAPSKIPVLSESYRNRTSSSTSKGLWQRKISNIKQTCNTLQREYNEQSTLFNEMQQECKEHKSEYDKCKRQFDETQQKCEAHKSKSLWQQNKISELEQKYNTLLKEYNGQSILFNKMQQECKAYKSESLRLQNEISELKQENDTLQREYNEQSTLFDEMQQECEAHKAEYDECKKQLDEAQDRLVETKHLAIVQKLRDQIKQKNQLATEQQDKKNQIKQKDQHIAKLKNEIIDLKNQNKYLKIDADQSYNLAAVKFADYINLRELFKEEKETHTKDITEKNEIINDQEKKLIEKDEQIVLYKKNNHALQKQVKEKEDQVCKFSKAFEGLVDEINKSFSRSDIDYINTFQKKEEQAAAIVTMVIKNYKNLQNEIKNIKSDTEEALMNMGNRLKEMEYKNEHIQEAAKLIEDHSKNIGNLSNNSFNLNNWTFIGEGDLDKVTKMAISKGTFENKNWLIEITGNWNQNCLDPRYLVTYKTTSGSREFKLDDEGKGEKVNFINMNQIAESKDYEVRNDKALVLYKNAKRNWGIIFSPLYLYVGDLKKSVPNGSGVEFSTNKGLQKGFFVNGKLES